MFVSQIVVYMLMSIWFFVCMIVLSAKIVAVAAMIWAVDEKGE